MISKAIAIIAMLLLPLSLSLWHRSHASPYEHRYDLTLYKSLRVSLNNGVCGLRLLAMPTKVASRSEFYTPLNRDPLPGPGSLRISTEVIGPNRITWVVFPLWLSTVLLIGTSLLPVYTGPIKRWRRRHNGLCVHCGYNLRGNRTGRCPECGTRFRSMISADGRRRF